MFEFAILYLGSGHGINGGGATSAARSPISSDTMTRPDAC